MNKKNLLIAGIKNNSKLVLDELYMTIWRVKETNGLNYTGNFFIPTFGHTYSIFVKDGIVQKVITDNKIQYGPSKGFNYNPSIEIFVEVPCYCA